MPETVTGTGESQPADDLRSLLAAAHDEQAQEAEPAPKPKAKEVETPKVEAEAEQGETETEAPETSGERARGPDGKFAKKEEAEEEVAETKPAETAPALEPPTYWKAADKETFKKLPADAQKILVERQKDMDADYTKKTQAIAEFKREYEPVDKFFEPYRDVMAQRGFTPRTLIEAWGNVEKQLAAGEDSAVNVIRGLVHNYRIPPTKIAAALDLRTPVAPANTGTGEGELPVAQTQPVQLPPELIAELNGLKQTVHGLTYAQQAAQQAAQAAAAGRVQSQIDQFKSAKDANGTLLHPHFDELEGEMTRLAQVAIAGKQPMPELKALYENAVWANPSTREKMLTAQKQQEQDRSKAEARAKAAAAKKASSSVTGSPGAGQTPNPGARAEKSLREQLEEAAADSLSA